VGVDALVLITPWDEFRRLDLARIRDTMRRPVLIDGRNLYDPLQIVGLGYSYHAIGRAAHRSTVERRARPALRLPDAPVKRAARIRKDLAA
jgi:UDPglucose 6-dehydrogenase